jgi:hypothetical protein
MKTVYEGMSLEEVNRSPAQKNCIYMYNYQSAAAFTNPKIMYRLMTGAFKAGSNGVQLQSFEPEPGFSRGSQEEPDFQGRNKGIIETLNCFVAWVKTFVNKDFMEVFAPVQAAFRESEFLQRIKSSVTTTAWYLMRCLSCPLLPPSLARNQSASKALVQSIPLC